MIVLADKVKELKISKELLSEVMGVQIFKCFVNNGICSYHDEYFYKDINIYEFVHLNLKQWAMNKGFQIISGLSDEPAHRRSGEKAYAKINHYYGEGIDNLEYKYKIIKANTETEAVIKASEYVLKEIN